MKLGTELALPRAGKPEDQATEFRERELDVVSMPRKRKPEASIEAPIL
jgi:hypothetical protein